MIGQQLFHEARIKYLSGKKIDVDNAGGSAKDQCYDPEKLKFFCLAFVRNVDIPRGGWGAEARGWPETIPAAVDQLYDSYSYGKGQPQVEDTVVWTTGRYGHISSFDSYLADGRIQCFGQNSGTVRENNFCHMQVMPGEYKTLLRLNATEEEWRMMVDVLPLVLNQYETFNDWGLPAQPDPVAPTPPNVVDLPPSIAVPSVRPPKVMVVVDGEAVDYTEIKQVEDIKKAGKKVSRKEAAMGTAAGASSSAAGTWLTGLVDNFVEGRFGVDFIGHVYVHLAIAAICGAIGFYAFTYYRSFTRQYPWAGKIAKFIGGIRKPK